MKRVFNKALFIFVLAAPAWAQNIDVMRLSERILNNSQVEVLDHNDCHQKASAEYQYLFNLSLTKIDFKAYSKEQLQKAIDQTFQARLNLRRQFINFDPTAANADACFDSISDLNRALRYMEDYLIEAIEGKSAKKYVTFQTQGAFFNVNPEHTFNSYNELQSGDVILTRGKEYSSAGIARVGQRAAQFSHISFVYKDDKGQLFTIESHVETGTRVEPIIKHIKQENTRSVVFRFEDHEAAAKAAKYMYDKVKARKLIPYDFTMNYKDNYLLFCSEVVYDGFYNTSNGEIDVPRFKTKFSTGLIPFLSAIGMKINKQNVASFDTFSPADIEFDTRFELIAEWRDPSQLHESKIKDAVLTKIFGWMDLGYRLDPLPRTSILSFVGWVGRRTPLLKKYLIDQLPNNMRVSQVRTFLTLDVVAEVLHENIVSKERRLKREMSFKEMFEFLEYVRVKAPPRSFRRAFHTVPGSN